MSKIKNTIKSEDNQETNVYTEGMAGVEKEEKPNKSVYPGNFEELYNIFMNRVSNDGQPDAKGNREKHIKDCLLSMCLNFKIINM